MNFSQGFSLSQQISQTQRQEVTQKQVLSQRLRLLQVLRGEKYTPSGKCPKCGRTLTPAEIINGFNRDPYDYTTKCTGCETRFNPKLKMHLSNGDYAELKFYCEMQAIQIVKQIRGACNDISPETIKQSNPSAFYSLITHCGSIKEAYRRAGGDLATYAKTMASEEEQEGWKDKVVPFLGEMPDTQIAACAGISVYQVRKLRNKMGIEPCKVVKENY